MELENNVISYEDFCGKYAKEMNDVRKYNIAYGSKLKDPVRSDLILFVGSNLKDSDELSSIISDTLANKGNKKVVAIAQKEIDAEILKNTIETHRFRTEKAHEYLATAQTIVTDSILPFWFIRRKEQTVIYLCSHNTLAQENRVARIPFSTAMLKSSKIIVKDHDELDKLHELYGIKDVYHKPILESDIAQDKINIILEKSINATEHIFKKEKETIAIYVKWNEFSLIYPCIDFLTSQFDYSRFDVTLLLSKGLDNEISKLQIENLNKHVRVLQRKGTYCETMEQYRKTQYLIRNMQQFENVYDAYQKLDNNILERERKKIWGDLSFDYVIGLGYIRAVWLTLLDMDNTKGKFYVEPRQKNNLFLPETDNSPKAHTYFNQNKLYNMVFDKFLFTCPDMVQFGIEKMKLDSNKIYEFSIAANTNAEDFKSIPLQTAKYRGQDYYVLDQNYFTPNKSRVDIIPVPKPNSYISDIRNQDIEEIISRFSQLYTNNENLYIHGEVWSEIEPFVIRYDLESRVFSLGNTNWQFDKMGQFFEQLDGYVTTDNHERANAIRTFTEQLGLPSFELSESKITKLEPEFADMSECREFVKTEFDRLFV